MGEKVPSLIYQELIKPFIIFLSILFNIIHMHHFLLLPLPMEFDDAFFNRNWAGSCWNRWAGPLALDVELLCKNNKQRGSTGARPLPLRCLNQFFPDEEKINCLESEFSAYLLPMGWPGIYSSFFFPIG